jgi:hypothetical protein
MPKLPKPKPPTFNGHTFTPSERRAILTAATKGARVEGWKAWLWRNEGAEI